MKSENDENVDRSPGQIEDGVNPRARNELTERIEVAQQLATRAARSRSTIDNCRHDAAGDQAIKADAGAGQNPCPHRVEPSQRQQRQQQRDRQHHERDLAGARDHPVIDLQHVKRRGQIQQVDGEAEHRGSDEIAARFAQQASKLVGFRLDRHLNKRCPLKRQRHAPRVENCALLNSIEPKWLNNTRIPNTTSRNRIDARNCAANG